MLVRTNSNRKLGKESKFLYLDENTSRTGLLIEVYLV